MTCRVEIGVLANASRRVCEEFRNGVTSISGGIITPGKEKRKKKSFSRRCHLPYI
jgi:hypothetical protein